MSKRKADQPAPWIDLWGKPTWDNPFGQLRPNPEYVERKRRARRQERAAASGHEQTSHPAVESEAPTPRRRWGRQPASGTNLAG